MTIQITTVYNFKGQKVGDIVGEFPIRTFVSNRTEQHFMRIHNGFGISERILIQLLDANAIYIVFEYYGKPDNSGGFEKYPLGHHTWKCHIGEYVRSSKRFTFQESGYQDEQRFVDIKNMTEINNKKEVLIQKTIEEYGNTIKKEY